MSNRIVSEFAEQLRNSSFSQTLCTQTGSIKPLMVNFEQIPGVARAFVTFEGWKRPVGFTSIIRRSHNISRIVYLGTGKYLIEFPANTFQSTNYIPNGSLSRTSLTGADSFNFVFQNAGGSPPALTSITVQTFTTVITAISSEDIVPRDCDLGNFVFFA